MFKTADYGMKSSRLSDVLPWAALVAPGTVLNKDGSLQKTLRYRGPDLQSSTSDQLVALTARLNNILKRLGSGWAFFIEARRDHALSYPSLGDFPDSMSWLLDLERRDLFESQQGHFESHYFLTFQYLPPKESMSKMSKLFIESQYKADHDYKKVLEFFDARVNRIFDVLSDFMFEAHLLDDQETLSYLHNTISTHPHQVSVPDIPMYIDGIIPDSPLTGGLEPKLGDAHLRVISIMGFPSSSVPAILDQLNHLPIAYRWMTRFIALDKLDAEKILKTYKRQWFSKRKGVMNLLTEVFSKTESAMVDTASMRKSQDADAASQSLADDHVSFGYYTATVVVWDEDYDVAYEKQREVERVINGLGFVTVPEKMNAIDAWLSSLPGHCHANVRMPIIHSLNLAHMIPFSALWAGPEINEHFNAPPLFYARTTGNTPYRFSNHIEDVGHQMIIGPTGSGKSVLLNLMALQFLRYEHAQVFVFDKGGSFLASTLATDGVYYEVGTPKSPELVFQPLAHIHQKAERVWAAGWIHGLLENENIELTPELKEVVWNALESLSVVPVEQRTMTGLKALIQDVRVRRALEPFTLSGPYGFILDADQERIAESKWLCFEMEGIMNMPQVVAPILVYLFHQLEKRFDGSPTLLILDEAWLFLDHPLFASKIKDWLKTLRKLNVSVIFAVQSVDDTLKSDICSALIESCASRVFLPNDRALEPNIQESYQDLGLNDRQIQILSNAIPKMQYYFESSRGNALFDLGLGPIGMALTAVSSPQDKKKLVSLYQKHSEHDQFIKAYLKSCELEWAIKIIESRGQDHE